jgi:hypothetical protein
MSRTGRPVGSGIIPAVVRFEKKYIPEPNSGCWIWLGSPRSGGYGMIFTEGRESVMAHRFSYELHKGKIPPGLQIDHLCRNRACVNPDHLEPVTCKENIRRGLKGTAMKTHCVNGHPFDLKNTYIHSNGDRQCRECGRLYARKKRGKLD